MTTNLLKNKNRLFTAVTIAALAVFFVIIVEAAGYARYRSYAKYHDVIATYLATGQNPASAWIPNALWHHDLNPEHPGNEMNQLGTRGANFNLEKEPGELRIVCAGDSTTQGTLLPFEQTYPFILERFLSFTFPDRRITCVNGGIGSQNSAFNLSSLGNHLIHFKPDIVLIKSAYNDYLPYLSADLSASYLPSFPEVFYVEPLPKPPPLWARVSFWGKIWLAKRLHENQKRLAVGVFNDNPDPETVSKNLNKLNIYSEQVRGMIGIAGYNNAKPMLLDLPLAEKTPKFSPQYRRIINSFNTELESISKDLGVTLIKTAHVLRGADFIDHCHNSSQGHQRIAAQAANAIYENLGLDFKWEEIDNAGFKIVESSRFEQGRPLETILDPGKDGYASVARESMPAFFTIDIGQSVDNGMIIFSWPSRSVSALAWSVNVSADSAAWSQVYQKNHDAELGATFVKIKTPTRFIKVAVKDAYGQNRLMINRLNLWKLVNAS